MHARRRRPQYILLPLLALLLLISACMGDGDDTSDDQTSASPSTNSTTTAIAPTGTTPSAPVVSQESVTPPAADNTPTLDASARATPTTEHIATVEQTATATTTPMATPVTSDDPVVKELLDAMPPLRLFPEGWVELIETQADRGFTHGHCRMDPSMALNAHVVAHGGNLDEDDIGDSLGPIVNGTYQMTPGDRSTEVNVSIMDLSAVPLPDAARIVVDAFLAEDTCDVWEPEPGIVLTYGDATPSFPVIGDDGAQWVRTIHASSPRGEWDVFTLVFAVGNRLVSVESYATDPATVPQALVESVAQPIAASLEGTAFEPERRALLGALSTAGAEIPAEWAPQERQVTAYPADGLPHHCGIDLPLPAPEPTGAGDAATDVRVTAEYTAMAGEPSTTVLLTLMHLPTAADAQAVVAFHEAEVTCETWTPDAQQGIEVGYAPVEVTVPRLEDEPRWARTVTLTSDLGDWQGVALVYAVENRVVFLISLAPVAEPIPAYVLETLTWKLTEALRRFPVTT